MPYTFNPFTNNLDATTTVIVPPGTVASLTGNSGGAVPPNSGNINVVGDGTTISVVGNAGSNTLTVSSIVPRYLVWSAIGSEVPLVAGNAYMVDTGVGTINFSLPVSGIIGDTIVLVKVGGGGTMQISLSGTQVITLGNSQAYAPTGSVSTTELGASLTLVYFTTDSWYVYTAVGNFTLT